MYPVIFKIGFLTIYSYGAMLVAAVFVCGFLLQKKAKRLALSPEAVVDFIFWVVIAGLIGSRIFFILINLSYFLENPKEIIMIQHGGLAWQGGLLLGSLTAFLLIRKNKWPLWRTLDFFAPYAALGQAIGRLGCFLNGCCYGREASWGIYFPVHHARLYPTQLFDAFGLFCIFLFLNAYQNSKRRDGEVVILYFISAALLRFFVEFLRADHEILFLNLSLFQLVSLGIIGFSAYACTFVKSR